MAWCGGIFLSRSGRHPLSSPPSLRNDDRKFLLSNSMDNTLRQWDVRPFVTGSRQVKAYQGATVRLLPLSLRINACICPSLQTHHP